MVKNLPAIQKLQETWVRPLSWEDALEEEMATDSSNLAWCLSNSFVDGHLVYSQIWAVRNNKAALNSLVQVFS